MKASVLTGGVRRITPSWRTSNPLDRTPYTNSVSTDIRETFKRFREAPHAANSELVTADELASAITGVAA